MPKNSKLRILVVENEPNQTKKPSEALSQLLEKTHQMYLFFVEKGLSKEKIIQNITYKIALQNQFFLQIAQIRALRIVFTEWASAVLGQEYMPQNLLIEAMTTSWDSQQALTDPHWNMLSNTTQSLSAVLAGADSVLVKPHQKGNPNAMPERIARNVSTILREESYLDKIANPITGSYFLDVLTDQLAQSTWEKMQKRWDIV